MYNTRFEQLRMENNYRQDELSSLFKHRGHKMHGKTIDVGTIGKYDRGDNKKYDKDVIKAYREVFDVSADFLLGFNSNRTKSENMKMICKTTGLSENTIRTLRGMNGKYINENGKVDYIPSHTDIVIKQALDKILENPSSAQILYYMGVYLGLDSDTMDAYVDSNDCFEENPITHKKSIVLRLSGGDSIEIDSDTILTSLFDKIRQGLDKIKDGYYDVKKK